MRTYYDLLGSETVAALNDLRSPHKSRLGKLVCRCPAHEFPHTVAAKPRTSAEWRTQAQCEAAVEDGAREAVLNADYNPTSTIYAVAQGDFIA